ncbi:hypothetical protein CspeluHIS016_0401890 [Cutaneotrichosporon spelunceum]|uniref:Uncharacterized protein n=1 Tax=Cutaneotrichosporon spelunceum TaxID=1672016 RepID=A0AAD3TVP5_9TREE|nr:hypothetical protein CspeluHIS016_0401890 [Cutaneotrichosporon spelunceum]
MPPLTMVDDDKKKKIWVLVAVILGFTLKGLVWLGLGGAIVAGWRRWRPGPRGPELVEGSGDSERRPLLEAMGVHRDGVESERESGAGRGEQGDAGQGEEVRRDAVQQV